jgi:hypothetical protein
MKKIFTLLFAVGFLTAAYAQTGSRDRDTRDTRDNQQYDQRVGQQNSQWDNNVNSNGRDNDNRYNNINGSYGRSIAMQVAQINRKYDLQVQRVQNDFFMRRFEKMRVIRSLEVQRQREIKMLYVRTNSRDRQYDRGFDANHRY